MKKNILLLTGLCVLLLAACNTTSTEPIKDEEQSTSDSTSNGSSEQTKNDEEAQKNEESGNVNQEENSDNSEEKTTHSITYLSKGKEIKESTTQVNSPQQNYTIDLLNGYTLTAEEPGRDMVLYNDNNAISMRIEVFNKADVKFDDVLANTTDTVMAIAPDGQYDKINLTNINLDENIKKIDTFYVELESETVSTILFEKNNIYVRLTIYDDKSDLKDALLKMGLSIR